MKSFFITFSVFFITFFPTYLFGGTSNGQIVLFLIYFIFVFFIGVCFLFKNRLIVPSISLVYLLVGVMVLFTVISKVDFVAVNLIINHYRYFIYFFVFVISYNIAYRYGDIKVFESRLYFLAFFISVFIIFQLVLPNSFLVRLITHKPPFDFLGFRIGGPFEWSYIYAFSTFPIIVCALDRFIRYGFSFFLFPAFLLLLFYFLSQSKAAYLSFILFYCLYFLSSVYFIKNNRKLYFLSAVLFLAVTMLVLANLDKFAHVIKFFVEINNGSVDASTQTRLNQMANVKYSLEENILLGSPSKYLIIENAFAHYLYNYGFIGFIGYCIFIVMNIIQSFINVKNVYSYNLKEFLPLSIGYFFMNLTIPIYALGSSPTDANKSAYFYYVTFAFLLGCTRKEIDVIKGNVFYENK
ncbi:hypothetical protein [Shewanella algae]|uniref:O-antigen polymerase n=1 Tax=Shewanella algae TaxID=38313 RepID=A0A379YH62_9GAMM|nr:hypothetical protein [Shewanella algae]MBO2607085.1 hypothetical protein [Shewanella algae]SUI45033.1 Uncharacterised protein [Shewanella algae]